MLQAKGRSKRPSGAERKRRVRGAWGIWWSRALTSLCVYVEESPGED